MNKKVVDIPNHLAIIVDGNGRWASEQGKSRSKGHEEGANNINRIIESVFSKGVKVLSLYVFSTENFKRSSEEVDFLMNLFVKLFKKNRKLYLEKNLKIIFSGRSDNLRTDVLKSMNELCRSTENCNGGIVNFCLNYGGHAEIVDATKKISEDILNNKMKISDIDENTFKKYLYNDLPMIDFLIRTSGELRVSNFMLYQLAYAEFYFTPVYFPAFSTNDLEEAFEKYSNRNRRYGGYNKK